MAKFTSSVNLNIWWRGIWEFSGAAGTEFSIPDSLYDEFNGEMSGVIPGLTWTETASEATADNLALKYDKTGGTISGAVTVTGALVAQSSVSTPSLSATIARFKGQPFFDVKAYGAAGDGSTDDTTAFQNTITAAQAVGRAFILLPPGTYQISSAISWSTALQWVGSGATIRANAASIDYWFGGTTGSDGWSVDGVRFDSATQAFSILTTGASVNDVTVRNCYFTGYDDTHGGGSRKNDGAIRIDGGNRCKVVNNTIYNFGINAPANTSGSVLVAAIRVNSTSLSHGAVISNNVIESAGAGIYVSGSDITITGNVLRDVADNGVYVIADVADWTKNVAISGNSFVRCEESIVLNGATTSNYLQAVSITGNTFIDWTNNVVAFSNRVRDVAITGNIMNQATTYHAYITLRATDSAALTTNVTIANNVFRGLTNFASIWLQQCTNVVVQGNVFDVDLNSAANFIVRFEGNCLRGIVKGNIMAAAAATATAFTIRSGTATACRFEDNILSNCQVSVLNIGTDTSFNNQTITAGNTVGTTQTPSLFHGTAAPSAGTWRLGDKVWNSSPAAGGTLGWVCTTAGSPGTWKIFGSIAT